jgi:hypothetical protein
MAYGGGGGGGRASRRRWVTIFQALAGDVAGGLVRDHIPHPVACQDEALVIRRPLGYGDLRLRDHLRFEQPVSYTTPFAKSNQTRTR